MPSQVNPTRTPSPVKFEVAPFENGKVVYQKLAPPTLNDVSGGMLFFYLRAKNQTDGTIIAREMVVSFPGTTIPDVALPSRDVVINAGATRTIQMDDTEAIELPGGSDPPTLRVTLTFSGLADPVVWNWQLVPHAVVYDFFAKPEAGDYGEYVLMPAYHMREAGVSQFFGYDVKTLGVNASGNLALTRNGSTDNEDYFLFDRPLYAMADGIVIRAIDDNVDNPGMDLRTVMRKPGTYQGSVQIDAVSVTDLDEGQDATKRLACSSRTSQAVNCAFRAWSRMRTATL